MNNHKFRAWDDTLLRYLPPMTIEEIGKCNMSGTNWYQLTLEQWTGVYDIDGIEIYEGDLLEISRKDKEEHFITEVKWDNDGACFLFQINKNGGSDLLDSIPHKWRDNYWSYYDYCKVIGHIHEGEVF